MVAAEPIGEIVWAAKVDPTTNAPVETVITFTSDSPRITASVPVYTMPAGASITASWEYNDTTLDAFTTRMLLPDAVIEQWISFFIDRDPEVAWPEGEYAIAVSIDGAVVQIAAIEVVSPD